MFTKNEDADVLGLFLQCYELIVTLHIAEGAQTPGDERKAWLKKE